MPAAKRLSKEQILAAMAKTQSNMAAARYLNLSYWTYKKYAKLYKATEEGYETLFDQHKNQCGKGIPKFLKDSRDSIPLLDIIEGYVEASSYTPEKMKHRLITEGYIEEKCSSCGFCERRELDYRMPILLNFKDKNKKNYRLENIELLCYNCYYLSVGNIFNDKQIRGIEDHLTVYKGEVDWEVDSYNKERLKELGLDDEDEEYDIVARE